MSDFEGKRILVIGASSGIGAETACVLGEKNAEVILVARRKDKLEEVCKGIQSNKTKYYTYDISDIDGIEELIKCIVSENGKLDGLVYVAGMSNADVPIKFLTYERQISTFNTNYFGFMECVRQVTKKGRYNEGFRIVSISSIAAIRGDKCHATYAATKAAMDASIRCIAKELAPKKICINSVAPSMVKTEMYDSYIKMQGDAKLANERILDRQYLGIAETRDVSNAIVFLLSEEARFITGIALPVDGGYSAS